MANSLSIDNCLIQVRSCLQEEGIKLWLEPYYVQGIGPVDAELEVNDFDMLWNQTFLILRHFFLNTHVYHFL